MAFNGATYIENAETGSATVGTSSAALSDLAGLNAVKLKAAAGNAGIIYVGKKGTATTADWPLSAGEETDWIPVSNLSQIAAIASQASQTLHYLGVR